MRDEVYNLPPFFLERLRRCIPPHKWDVTANTFVRLRAVTFRVNTLKAASRDIRVQLKESGFSVRPVPWYPDAFILERDKLRPLQETPSYREGKIYVQSLSSMFPVLVLEPEPGENILDLTAAPGSKTTQMAALMKNEGNIVANDNNRVRFFKLKANIALQGAARVRTLLTYGESFGRKFPNHFDRVLVDAPCSAEGRFEAANPRTYRYWKPAKIREMARKQFKLLLSGLHALRAGGTLVYSTCTFAPEENEAVVSRALKKLEGFIELDRIPLSIVNILRGLGSWEGRVFHPSIGRTIRILPTPLMQGFYVARFRKLRETST